jgi:hypothetical protein
MRDAMSDRFSVVVPTRNRPDHAAECAKAILAGGGFDELIGKQRWRALLESLRLGRELTITARKR